jgi:predicted ATPase/DNA-binding winged helix-turn-helix (wHTH) protein
MATAQNQVKDGLSFGPFNLLVGERLLTKEGAAVELGARAFDILLVLLSAPNEIVSKQELMSRVWPDVTVEEGSLRFHMSGLRQALGDGKDGARYITTLPGRGYCFVAPVSRMSNSGGGVPPVPANFPHANLPRRLSRMVGRDEDIRKLAAQLTTSRVITIVGAGGVGKTTVAVAVGHYLNEVFNGAALFVDFGMLSDPNLVESSLACMLGLSVGSRDVRPRLMTYLRDKRILLILDTCEHLIDAVAELVAEIIESAQQIHVLTTSREALRIEGERVYRLDTLACPPDDPEITASAVQKFPATQLFIERAAASGASLDLSDSDARIVASICRRLDGVALAVELAARRVESCGLLQTADLLDQHLKLGWRGSRTGPPRQKTLQATLDWSFRLLAEPERVVLRRLAVFVGYFTLDAALAIVDDESIDRATVFGAIDSLVAKSLVATQPIGAMMRYRLPDVTRAYALEIKIDTAERDNLARRHAAYYQRWLAQTADEWASLAIGPERAPYFAGLSNVRAALEWCFGEGGDLRAGISLAAAAAPVFQAMALLFECHRWSQRALLALDDALRGGAEEMHLQAGLGTSSMYLHGETDAALAALNRSVEIAEMRNEAITQIGLLALLLMFHFRRADLKTTLLCARRGRAAAETVDDPAAIALAHSMLGRTLHVTGDLKGAREELEASLHHWSRVRRSSIYLAREFHYTSDTSFARILWLQGHPTQALEYAHQTIERVKQLDNPALFVVVLAWAVSVFLWAGDWESAEEYIDTAISQAESNSISTFIAVGRARSAELAIRRGDVKNGVEKLRTSLETNRAVGAGPLTTEFRISLLHGLLAVGQFVEAAALVDEEIQRVEEETYHTYMPELLRVKGGIYLSVPERRLDDAENCLKKSLELSRHHGARAWELRSATDLAALWASQGRCNDAEELLQPIFEQFAEGSKTADLKAAEHLLATLRPFVEEDRN